MSDASSDTSGVRFPPPLIYAGGFAAGYGAHRLMPIRLWPEPPAVERLLGWGLLVAGVLLAVVLAVLARVNWALGIAALGAIIFLAVWIVRRLKR